jgi:hypothetical protein
MGVKGGRGEGAGRIWYLDRAGGPPVQAPVIVKVEADQTEDGDVEENFPAAHEPAVTIHPHA